jgi:hypothetical protein
VGVSLRLFKVGVSIKLIFKIGLIVKVIQCVSKIYCPLKPRDQVLSFFRTKSVK